MSDTTFIDPFNTLSTDKDQSSLLGTPATGNIFTDYASHLAGSADLYAAAKSLGISSPATPSGTSTDTATGPDTSTSAATSGGGFLDSVGDYFGRGVVIILGFIFVGVGLNMFKQGTIAIPRV